MIRLHDLHLTFTGASGNCLEHQMEAALIRKMQQLLGRSAVEDKDELQKMQAELASSRCELTIVIDLWTC